MKYGGMIMIANSRARKGGKERRGEVKGEYVEIWDSRRGIMDIANMQCRAERKVSEKKKRFA